MYGYFLSAHIYSPIRSCIQVIAANLYTSIINVTICLPKRSNFFQSTGISVNISLYVDVSLLFLAQQPPVGQVLLIHEVSRSHSTTHHSRKDSSGGVISWSQRPPPDITHHSQQTDIHAPDGI
jgi:hypothetical protein